MSTTWKPLALAPATLVDAREQLHWAVQLAAASADAVIERLADDSHTNLHWDEASSSLVGNPLPDGHRIAFHLASFAVQLRKDSRTVTELALGGRTLKEAFDWLASALGKALGKQVQLKRRDYTMPDHAVATTAPFSEEMGAAIGELGRYFANANHALKALADADPRATPVAVWPHHFDMGGILILEPDKPFEEATQIGFGMSPGDSQIQEPYYYITPWPLPNGASLPELPGPGRWERKAFAGALLLSSDLVALGEAGQEKALGDFLRSAIAASIALLPN